MIVPIRVKTGDSETERPLSFAQARLWFIDQVAPGNNVYNIPLVLRFKGQLSVRALEQSLNQIVRRHETLRSTVRADDGKPVSVILPELTLKLPLISLEHLPATTREAEARRVAVERARQAFDLNYGPLVRVTLLRLDQREHWLLVTMHHIVSDGWSLSLFTQELAALYKQALDGSPSALPDLPIQYADYAQWQREWLQGDIFEKQIAYWKERLGDGTAILELPTDRPRPAVQTHRGARQFLEIPDALAESLRALSRQEKATLFMTLLAAFQTVLFRHTGQEDITVGSPIAGRNRSEVEHLIGLFVNTLVLRTDLSGNPSFRELLARVRQVTLGAYAHPDLPFEKLVERLQPERDPSRSPLFQVMFAFQNVPSPQSAVDELTLEREFIDSGTAMFDLTLFVFPQVDGLGMRLEYNTDLFDSSTITRMLGHIHTLLEAVVANPDEHISDLPLLTQSEQHQLLTQWNATSAEYPRSACLHQLFEEQVRRTPNAVAVVFEDTQLTYAELNSRANQVGHHLQSLGVTRDALVGLCVERSEHMLVGLLGILKAGGAYVPLDPAYPQDRLSYMLTDSGARVLVTQQSLTEVLSRHTAQVVCVDSTLPHAASPHGDPPNEVCPEDRAYVIYTSGSTGRPKGVEIPHRAAVNFLYSMRQVPGLTERDVLLAVTTLSFDIALLELVLPVTVGARVVVTSTKVAADGKQLQEQLTASKATVMQATPATWRLLLESAWPGNKQLKILCGGEALPRDLAHELRRRCGALWNMYGPTETTVWSAVHQIEEDEPILIGRPISNTQIYILDSQRRPVPIGSVGELYIGGDGLARGYLNRPELTAEKFVANPFRADPESRLYATGDLARFHACGAIECLGRRDHQVKIRGFRVELDEVQAAMIQHPRVQQAVASVTDDPSGAQCLAGYIVPRGAMPTAGELRSMLLNELPEYMVPSVFLSLDALPLTPNGKVDRRALPRLDPSMSAGNDRLVPPRDGLEHALLKIWKDVLGRESIGVHDNFFDIGGHSLLAVRLVNRIDQTFNTNVSVITLVQAPTVAQLADALRRKGISHPVRVNRSSENRIAALVSRMRRSYAAMSRQMFGK